MMYLFQGIVIFLVAASDIRWNWMGSPLASGFLGVVLSSFLTLWWVRWRDRKYKTDNVKLPAHIETMIDDGIHQKLSGDKPAFKKWGFLYLAVPVGMLIAMTVYTEYFMD